MAVPHELALEILNKGTLYVPATKHYADRVNPRVVCDYCRRDNLSACIGYKEYDICLPCADRLTSGPVGLPALPDPFASVPPTPPEDSVRQREPYWQMPLTRMMQDSVRWRPMTKMMQDSIRFTAAMKQDSVRRRRNPATSSIDDPLIDPSILLGLTVGHAKAAYPEISIRIVERDGVSLVRTDDFRTERINVGIKQGVISKILGKF